MPTRRLAVFLILIALLAQPRGVAAQIAPGPVRTDWDGLKTIPSGDELVVELKSKESLKGRFSNVSDSTLTLARGKRTVEIKRGDVSKIHRLLPKSTKKATLIGLGVGASIGAGIGAGYSRGGEPGENYPIVLFGGVGAGLGALAGYLIGRGKRRLLYYQSP